MYANYFYNTSVIFSNFIITYREPFTICIGHHRRTDVIGIDCMLKYMFNYGQFSTEKQIYFKRTFRDNHNQFVYFGFLSIANYSIKSLLENKL